jgi:MFS family permease
MSLAQGATSPSLVHEASLRYPGWRAVCACFLMALFLFGFGLYGQGIYLVELQRLNGWPAALISGASTLSLLLSNILATFTSELVARLGLRRLVFLGLAALAGSMILLAFATSPGRLYLALTLMSLGWVGMGTVVIATIVSLWFETRRGLAISIAFTGASCGGVVVAPLLVLLIGRFGFSPAMLMATATMLLILVPLLLIWVRPQLPGTVSSGGHHQAQSATAATGTQSRRMIMRRLAFWTISIPFALALVAQVGFIVHQIALLEPRIGRPNAGLAVGLMTFMAIVGRLVLGLVIDAFNPRLVTAASLASQACALLIILATDNEPVVLAACAVFGFSVGNLITLPPLIIHREFDKAGFAVVMGLSTAISGTVGALGPGLVGLVRSWSGDYTAALLLCIALEIVAAAIVVQREPAAPVPTGRT